MSRIPTIVSSRGLQFNLCYVTSLAMVVAAQGIIMRFHEYQNHLVLRGTFHYDALLNHTNISFEAWARMTDWRKHTSRED